MEPKACTKLLAEMTDEDILKVIDKLLGSFDEGGIVYWVVLPSKEYGHCDYPEYKALQLRYAKDTANWFGNGYVIREGADPFAVLGEMERMAEYAYTHDGYTLIEPLGWTKNDVAFGITREIVVM